MSAPFEFTERLVVIFRRVIRIQVELVDLETEIGTPLEKVSALVLVVGYSLDDICNQ
jgi:hypothetical protein